MIAQDLHGRGLEDVTMYINSQNARLDVNCENGRCEDMIIQNEKLFFAIFHRATMQKWQNLSKNNFFFCMKLWRSIKYLCWYRRRYIIWSGW